MRATEIFGAERMPGDVQKARQPMLRTGLAPHMTEPVVDGAGKVVTPARPVFVNGERAKIDTPVTDADAIAVLPSISGGAI